MSRKIIMSMLIIVLALAAVGGATLAWFTDTATIEPNEFRAGTLKIRANEEFEWKGTYRPNWNPGDLDNKKIEVEVTGTKSVYLRMKITETWTRVQDASGSPITPVTVAYTNRSTPNIDWLVSGVAWNTGNAWQKITISGIDWWFYKGPVDAKLASGAKLLVLEQVRLAGTTGNEYQGATYTLAMQFEAIQTTNQAVDDVWGYKFVGGSWVPK